MLPTRGVFFFDEKNGFSTTHETRLEIQTSIKCSNTAFKLLRQKLV